MRLGKTVLSSGPRVEEKKREIGKIKKINIKTLNEKNLCVECQILEGNRIGSQILRCILIQTNNLIYRN